MVSARYPASRLPLPRSANPRTPTRTGEPRTAPETAAATSSPARHITSLNGRQGAPAASLQ